MSAVAALKPTKSFDKNLERAGSPTMLETESLRDKTVTILTDAGRKFYDFAQNNATKVTAASAAGGAVTLAACGGSLGALAGSVVGGAVGLVPAFFTFGLSIPIGIALGGSCGLVVGSLTGGTAGLACGGSVGYVTYSKRMELVAVWAKLQAACTKSCNKFSDYLRCGKKHAHEHVSMAKKRVMLTRDAALARCMSLRGKAVEVTSQRGEVQVTAASAAAGAVVLGTSGAAVGIAVGGTLGAAVGLVPALFTFGLSIPIFAAIGGSAGALGGATVGGSAGFVCGGGTGYGLYRQRGPIKRAAEASVTYVSSSTKYVRAKIVGGTGGTTDE